MLFFQSDLEKLKERIDELQKQKREVGKEVGESCEQSAETFHDNAPFDMAMHSLEIIKTQLIPLLAMYRDARVVAPPTSNNQVEIGHTVTFSDLDTGTTETYRIGSGWTDGENDISYISPIASLLLGSRVGERREGKIAGRVRKIHIEKIEL